MQDATDATSHLADSTARASLAEVPISALAFEICCCKPIFSSSCLLILGEFFFLVSPISEIKLWKVRLYEAIDWPLLQALRARRRAQFRKFLASFLFENIPSLVTSTSLS